MLEELNPEGGDWQGLKKKSKLIQSGYLAEVYGIMIFKCSLRNRVSECEAIGVAGVMLVFFGGHNCKTLHSVR